MGPAARNDFSIPSIVEDSSHSSGHPLDGATRALMEPRFGHDFSGVRVHTDVQASQAAREVNAEAFTVGQSIYFDKGRYQPESLGGKKLLAHELAHTVQQRGVDAGVQRFSPDWMVADSHHLEEEAGHAAEDVMRGGFARIVGAAPMVAPQRQVNQPQAPKVVAPVEPNATQKKMIDAARRAAAVRTQSAAFKANGVEGALPFQEARRLAQIKFDWDKPNMDQIGGVLSGMGGGLVTVDIKVAGAGDPECGSRAGYVRGHQPPIVLCPGFFKDPANDEGRIRSMIHEMAHVKGIGKADVAEQYFVTFDCTSKGAFESADSWANYVHCLSGQTPDKPEEIVSKKTGTPAPPKKPGTK